MKSEKKKIRLKMKHIYYYFIIFALGVISSLAMMYFIINYIPNERKKSNFMSDEHYLQVRDDYSIFSLTPSNLDDDGERQLRKNPKRNGRSDLEGNFN